MLDCLRSSRQCAAIEGERVYKAERRRAEVHLSIDARSSRVIRDERAGGRERRRIVRRQSPVLSQSPLPTLCAARGGPRLHPPPARQLYARHRAPIRASSAAPGHSFSYGTWTRGCIDVLPASCRSARVSSMYSNPVTTSPRADASCRYVVTACRSVASYPGGTALKLIEAPSCMGMLTTPSSGIEASIAASGARKSVSLSLTSCCRVNR